MVSAPSKPDKDFFRNAETAFNEGFRNHTRDFYHKKYANSTELSKYMWKLEDEIITSKIEYKVNQS